MPLTIPARSRHGERSHCSTWLRCHVLMGSRKSRQEPGGAIPEPSVSQKVANSQHQSHQGQFFRMQSLTPHTWPASESLGTCICIRLPDSRSVALTAELFCQQAWETALTGRCVSSGPMKANILWVDLKLK